MSPVVRRIVMAVVMMMLVTAAARAAVLDARTQGSDLELSWDTATTEDILRGNSPDNLLPWLSNATSPVIASGESAPGSPPTFYKLASGSNMAWRMEATFTVDPATPMFFPVTLPERRAAVVPEDLFAAWPTLLEVFWWERAQWDLHQMMTTSDGLLGDPGPLPVHGAVVLVFSDTTTIHLAGSDEPTFAGLTADEIAFALAPILLPVPPHARSRALAEILCGRAGIDWQDADANGLPDRCGTDLDMNGTLDTGFYRGGVDTRFALSQYTSTFPGHPNEFIVASFSRFGGHAMGGVGGLAVPPGGAAFIDASVPPQGICDPCKVPTW